MKVDTKENKYYLRVSDRYRFIEDGKESKSKFSETFEGRETAKRVLDRFR